jgi:polyisoprenoid-binding protein YceI
VGALDRIQEANTCRPRPYPTPKGFDSVKSFRSFIPPLAAMLMAASGGSSAGGVLIDKSEIKFVSKQMGSNVSGRFRRWKANVDFQPSNLSASKAGFEIELASVELANGKSGAELKHPLWFDTARFPVATFESTAMRNVGSDRYEVAGTLSMKGVAKDVVVPVALKKDAAGNSVAHGQFTVKRLEFNVGEGLWADTDDVPDEVTVSIRMVLPPLA